jgi:hypothetical protein
MRDRAGKQIWDLSEDLWASGVALRSLSGTRVPSRLTAKPDAELPAIACARGEQSKLERLR